MSVLLAKKTGRNNNKIKKGRKVKQRKVTRTREAVGQSYLALLHCGSMM